MHFALLASGSKANALLVTAPGARILVDCGLSSRQIEERLGRFGVSPDSLDAVLITHEHSDHVAGLPIFLSRHRVPVYMSNGTAEMLPGLAAERFSTGESFSIGSIKVRSFALSHDAEEPCGFVFAKDGMLLGLATDSGQVTAEMAEALAGVNSLILEANHDERLLTDCQYPQMVKDRITSRRGHLSNRQAGRFLKKLLHSDFKQVALAHLSENSNTPSQAVETVRAEIAGTRHQPDIFVASRYEASPLFAVAEEEQQVAMFAI